MCRCSLSCIATGRTVFIVSSSINRYICLARAPDVDPTVITSSHLSQSSEIVRVIEKRKLPAAHTERPMFPQTDRPEVATPAGLNRAPSYRWPQYKLEELKYHTNVADSGGRDESADGDINRTNTRRFRRSLLRRLPHAWSSPVDTRLEIASLSRRGPGKAGDSDTQKKSAAGDANTFFLGDGRKLGDDPSETETSGGSVMAVVARTRDGLEAVDLNTGRPLIAVTLPAAASGAGVYVDINGDDLVDHVEVGGRVSCDRSQGA